MKRGNKSTGRTLRPVDFPELEKVQSIQPIEEYHFARRMFGVHKNMHSPGFYMGEGRVAARYMEKVIGDLRKKQQLLHVEAGKPAVQSTESRKLNVTLTTSNPAEPPQFSHSLTPTRKRAPVLTLPQSSFPPFAAVLTPTKTRVSPVQPFSDSPKFTPGRSKTPKPTISEILSKYFTSPRNDAKAVHALASLPIFRSQKFTKMNPKVHSENPITGERRVDTRTDSPTKKTSMREHGSLLINST